MKKNIDTTKSFEKMCTHLLCRRYKLSSSDIIQRFNQPGIEIYPIKVGDDYVGFQSKYCNSTSNFYSEAILYKGHQIYSQVLINVDGGRANIPLLNPITGEYKSEDYDFAKLFTRKETLDEYINRCQCNITRLNDKNKYKDFKGLN